VLGGMAFIRGLVATPLRYPTRSSVCGNAEEL
jgi:hypothetical protein